ncbi:hypothetical protein ACNKHL_07450 [Shigella flexneri]
MNVCNTRRLSVPGKELKAVQDAILKNGALNTAIVGQPAYKFLNWQASLYQKTPRF